MAYAVRKILAKGWRVLSFRVPYFEIKPLMRGRISTPSARARDVLRIKKSWAHGYVGNGLRHAGLISSLPPLAPSKIRDRCPDSRGVWFPSVTPAARAGPGGGTPRHPGPLMPLHAGRGRQIRPACYPSVTRIGDAAALALYCLDLSPESGCSYISGYPLPV